MLRKFEYFIIILLFLGMGYFFYLQWQEKTNLVNNNVEQNSIEKIQKKNDLNNVECKVDSDCKVDESIVHCPAEAHCENNKCVTYCVYNDVQESNLLKISDCLDVKPLSVKEGEYTSKWENDNLLVDFKIVLACNIKDLSAYYEIKNGNTVVLTYEYAIPKISDSCLCVRNLEYKIPNLNKEVNYNIIINKVEK